MTPLGTFGKPTREIRFAERGGRAAQSPKLVTDRVVMKALDVDAFY